MASVTVAPTTAITFAGSTKSMTATLKAADNTVLTGRTVTWTSDDPSIASVDSSGVVTGKTAGSTTIRAASEGKQNAVTFEVKPKATTIADFKGLFPFAAFSGNFYVGSDIDDATSQTQLVHLTRSWGLFAGIFPTTPGPYTQMFYTNDVSIVQQDFSAYCAKSDFAHITGRPLAVCSDAATGTNWWFAAPTTLPDYASALHELNHSFMEATRADTRDWPWLYEGVALSFESGAFDSGGTFGVTMLREDLHQLFKDAATAGTLVPLATLVTQNRTDFFGTAGELPYAQAGMLFVYLNKTHPNLVKGIATGLGDGTITTPAQAWSYVLAQTGKTTAEIEQAYTQFGTQ